MHTEEHCHQCGQAVSYLVKLDGKWVCTECKNGETTETVRPDRVGKSS
jgi:uncharacterized Zn finger protein (UPF0148 family)